MILEEIVESFVDINKSFPNWGPGVMRVPRGYLSNLTEFYVYTYRDYLWARNKRYKRVREQKNKKKQEEKLRGNESLYHYT